MKASARTKIRRFDLWAAFNEAARCARMRAEFEAVKKRQRKAQHGTPAR